MALNTRIGPTALAAALGLAALGSAGAAHADDTLCSDVKTSVLANSPNTHFIFGSGGSAITPTLAKVAYVLSQSADQPIFVFYQDGGGAAAGYGAFVGQSGGKSSNKFKYWKVATDVTGTTPTCVADDANAGGPVDFATTGGSLALFGLTAAADVGTFRGPTQGINVIVPKAVTDPSSISTEALYFVYGFSNDQYGDATSPVPWTDPAYIYKRDDSAFVQQFLRGAISTLGGNATNFVGFGAATLSSPNTNQGSVDKVAAATAAGHAQAAIGFTSGPTADKNRAVVNTLAYQHTGQDTGYWPDSSPDAFDKINIRNGHYFLWDTNLFFTKLSRGSNAHATLDQIANPDVQAFIGFFTGQTPSTDVTNAIITTGSIPQCAMQVTRASDFAGLSCYAPATPCGHYYESIATGTESGTACTKDADCGDAEPKCHFNYCEAY